MDELLEKARQQDDLWREPFLLAVAYKTAHENRLAQIIIRRLLDGSQGTHWKQRYHDVLLASECLAEAKESTIPSDLERDIVQALIENYTEAQQENNISICLQVHSVMLRLLLGLSSEAEHSALLLILQQTILDSLHVARQRATLTILALIALDLRSCSPVVFQKLIPPLLGLTELPAIGTFQPELPIQSPDFDIIDLALCTLSFLGAKGTSGASLIAIRSAFEQHLRQIARYSLQLGMLITPTVLPIEEANLRRYEKAVQHYSDLYKGLSKDIHITEQNITPCEAIYHDLLDSAEEACYPAVTHLLHMLERSSQDTTTDWQSIWQAYLAEQMNTANYIDYQICVFLWTILFSETQAQITLAALLRMHLFEHTQRSRYAQHFLMNVVSDALEYSDKFGPSVIWSYRKYLRELRYLRYMKELTGSISSDFTRRLRELRSSSYLRSSGHFNSLSGLRDLIFTDQFATTALMQRLPGRDETERIELLTLLSERGLQISKGDLSGKSSVVELVSIGEALLPFAQVDEGVRRVTQRIIRRLPAETEQEIQYILAVATTVQDRDIQDACVEALEGSEPQTDRAWTLLEQAQSSPITIVAIGANVRWQRRQWDLFKARRTRPLH